MTFSMMESAELTCFVNRIRYTDSAPAFCTKENKKQIQIHINNKRFNRNFSL